MPSGSCRTIWSNRWTASLRFACSVSTICLRDSTCWIWSCSLSISLICSSSFAISPLSSVLRLFWLSICPARMPCTRPTIARPSTASDTASDTNCRWRAWRFCSRCGSRLTRGALIGRAPRSLEASKREAGRDQQQRRILRELARPDAIGRLHVRERIAHDGRHAGALGDQLVESGQQRTPAGQHDLVDLVVRGRGEEELQCPGDLERERLHERLQDIVVVVLRQPLVLLRRLGLLDRQVECALDVERQLIAAEGLV